jgi:hypothetical protein
VSDHQAEVEGGVAIIFLLAPQLTISKSNNAVITTFFKLKFFISFSFLIRNHYIDARKESITTNTKRFIKRSFNERKNMVYIPAAQVFRQIIFKTAAFSLLEGIPD